jgi:hypothetical protein
MTVVSLGAQTPIDTECVSKPHHRVPDPEGVRYCTTCTAWLPIENFPRGKRRYCCKVHRWEMFGKLAKRKHMANAENKLLFKLWVKAYSDSKLFNSVWGDAPTKPGASTIRRVDISNKEIEQLLHCMVKTFHITSTICSMYDDLVELGKHIAIVPISPKEVICLSNSALVPSTVKRQLLKAFRLDGIEGYTKALRVAQAQSNVVFRPSAEQLCEMQQTLLSKNRRLIPEI